MMRYVSALGRLWKSYSIPVRSPVTFSFVTGRSGFSSRSQTVLVHNITKHFRNPNFWQTGGCFLLSFSLFDLWHVNEKVPEEDRVKRLVYEARKSQKDGELLKCEKYYHEALSVVIQRHQNKEIDDNELLQARTYLFDCLANLSFSLNEFDKAEKLYKETIKGCVQAGMPTNGNVILEISLKLANIYAIEDRSEEAILGFEFCINTLREKLKEGEKKEEVKKEESKKEDEWEELYKDTEALLGMCLDSYGRYLLRLSDYDKAEKMLSDSFCIAKKCLGDTHRQTLVIMTNLGVANIFKKNYAFAEQLILQAIKIGEDIDAEEISALYCNLGAVYLAQMQMEKAHEACLKGMASAQRNNDSIAVKKAKTCLQKVTDHRNEKVQVSASQAQS
ncbi:repeat 19, mitochondrial-like [Octopus vulgaris]|uniref:Repeat 19, mitochondrial-like n=2 Tax=Octopus TaxID=6643 RepID=A0AA36ALN2_OCTVU|nr:tetratricopeptide repeat protein 19, mitochondrial [Octopus sinensis]CAI9718368.1 repeat 19, mitochondrial-like [Octopus vulgaris]